MAASTYVNTLPHCSPASVGLARAHPNYSALKEVMNMKHNTTEMDCSIYTVTNKLCFHLAFTMNDY